MDHPDVYEEMDIIKILSSNNSEYLDDSFTILFQNDQFLRGKIDFVNNLFLKISWKNLYVSNVNIEKSLIVILSGKYSNSVVKFMLQALFSNLGFNTPILTKMFLNTVQKDDITEFPMMIFNIFGLDFTCRSHQFKFPEINIWNKYKFYEIDNNGNTILHKFILFNIKNEIHDHIDSSISGLLKYHHRTTNSKYYLINHKNNEGKTAIDMIPKRKGLSTHFLGYNGSFLEFENILCTTNIDKDEFTKFVLKYIEPYEDIGIDFIIYIYKIRENMYLYKKYNSISIFDILYKSHQNKHVGNYGIRYYESYFKLMNRMISIAEVK